MQFKELQIYDPHHIIYLILSAEKLLNLFIHNTCTIDNLSHNHVFQDGFPVHKYVEFKIKLKQ